MKLPLKLIFLPLCTAIAISVSLVLFTTKGGAIYANTVSEYPAKWSEVKIGMTSTEVRELIGTPTLDCREVKISDVWQISKLGVGLELTVDFDGNNTKDSHVTAVHFSKTLLGVTREQK